MRKLVNLLGSVGLILGLPYALAILACHFGILFSGLSTFAVVLETIVCSAIAVSVTAFVAKRKGKKLGWRTLHIEYSVLALVMVGVFSWIHTRQMLQIFLKPVPVSNEVRVQQGRDVLFNSYVHFTATPAIIAETIKAKELVEVTDAIPENGELSTYNLRESSKVSWSWWQPATMSKPRFYYRHHQSDAVQGWFEGWWVNGETNEVYAHIGG